MGEPSPGQAWVEQWRAELIDPALTTKTLMRASALCERLLQRGDWQLAVEVADTTLEQAQGGDVRLNVRHARALAQCDGTGACDEGPAVVADLLSRADDLYAQARAASDPALARGAARRLSQALTLLLHRALHTSEDVSPLAIDPAAYLAPLRRSRLYSDLNPAAPRVRRQPAGRQAGSLLLLTTRGSFFSGNLVDAAQSAGFSVAEATLGELEPEWSGMTALLGERVVRLVDSKEPRPAVPASLEQADTVLVDWADETAAWASVRLPRSRWPRRSTRLVVRLHSVEALSVALHVIDWSRVDLVVFVSQALQRLATAVQPAMGAVPSVVVPHGVAIEPQRAKEPSASSTLGMVGWGQVVKDPEFAVRVLQGLRERQPEVGWQLRLVGSPLADGLRPWESGYGATFEALLDEEGLRDAVLLTDYTDDVPAALDDVGWILSTSLREADPHGVLEGVLTGAVPVVRDWPFIAPWGGAEGLMPPEWVVHSVDDAVTRVCAVADRDEAANTARDWLLENRPESAARAALVAALRRS